jgi:hypothetical protein
MAGDVTPAGVREAVTRTQVHASYLSVLNAVAAR